MAALGPVVERSTPMVICAWDRTGVVRITKKIDKATTSIILKFLIVDLSL
jgi:hypothetical protein